MARPRSSAPKPAAQLVREQRDGLYAAGHQNMNMTLSVEVIAQIDGLKARYGLRSRDAVVARIIRQRMATTDPDAFTQRAGSPHRTFRRISPIIAIELIDYVKAIQAHFRGLSYGPIFEMILAEATPDALNSETVGENTNGVNCAEEWSAKTRTLATAMRLAPDDRVKTDRSSCFRRPIVQEALPWEP